MSSSILTNLYQKGTILYALVILVCASCDKKPQTLFNLVEPDDHGIKFMNVINETDSLNILTLEYIYNGGAVAIGDFNNDGLSDIYLGGNVVPDRLYINRGNLKFEDVTDKAGILPNKKWRSGVAVADINADGLLDIYVCASIKSDSVLRENILYLNKGVDGNGIPSFTDEAKQFGIADNGYSSNAAFIDYDRDGDLDLYVLTNTIEKGVPTNYRPKVNNGSAENTDRLYRNNGDNTFTNVSHEAGIRYEGYGLGIAVSDINTDGWPDLYISNDYIANDLLYVNNGDGTFSNKIDEFIQHQSQFSMGNDVADMNNDGYPDIITLDMLPEGNLRRKTVISGPSYTTYINNAKYDYAPQYVRNMLQLNNGNGTFSEIGQLAGIHQTEWSWSPLFADFDNDGFKDCFITNGFPRDITDKDFSNFRGGPGGNIATIGFLLDSIPVVKIANYAYKNNGDLTFSDVTAQWGMNKPSFSNGASFADFDNDGDLDYIVNNINEEVFLYENTLYKGKSGNDDAHYLRIRLKGTKNNPAGLGTKVWVYTGGTLQYQDHSVYRGYISSVEEVLHFGLGKSSEIDSVKIIWPDGSGQVFENVKSNQVLVVEHKNATGKPGLPSDNKNQLVRLVNSTHGINYLHEEDDQIDFNLQRTLPHKFSQMGPGLAVADVNGDGLDDFYVGASARNARSLFIQKSDGTFMRASFGTDSEIKSEDQGVLFFDADNDGDQDLYAVSGGFEFPVDDPNYQDKLYLNNGSGIFELSKNALPSETQNGSCVRAADYDQDGDLDLFVGGIVIPAQYPFPAESFILRNDKGTFTDVTAELNPGLKTPGIINDAIWSDVNNDGKIDLVLAGEFMPVKIFINEGTKFSYSSTSGLEKFPGWWTSLTAGDFDNDGDTDFIGGNLGLNNYYKASATHPLRVYAKDLDDNKSVEAVLTCYFKSEQGEMREYPIHFWDELNSQSPKFRRKFEYYRQYGRATVDKLLTPKELDGALMLECSYTSSSYIENKGNGKFEVKALPMPVQFAPIKGMVVSDVNRDGNLDVVMTGNDYGNEVFAGRYDAFTGVILLGDGQGNFEVSSSATSGFLVKGDAKGLASLNIGSKPFYLAAQNRDSLRLYESTNIESEMVLFTPKQTDTYGLVTNTNGKKMKVEFYFGSGYFSQSTRTIFLPATANEIEVFSNTEKPRKVSLSKAITAAKNP